MPICPRIFAPQLADFYKTPRISTDGALGSRVPSHNGSRPTQATEGLKRMRDLFRLFIANEQGATAIEYGLIAAGIAAAIIAVVASLGSNLNATFSSVSTALN
jgi:pilus assembly protein Flp/PilA